MTEFKRAPAVRATSAWMVAALLGLAAHSWFSCDAAFAQGSNVASSWPEIVAAAKKEGKVVLYTSQVTPVAQRFVEGFKKEYPEITVETVRGATGTLMARMEQERGQNLDGADVFISPELLWYLARAKEGKLLKFAGPSVKNWPSKYLIDDSIAYVSFEPFIIPYSTTLGNAAPKSYLDLLTPQFKDKLGTPDLISTTVTAWYDWLEKTQGSDYLTKLKAQNVKFYTDVSQLNQAIASGEIAAATFGVVASTKPVMDQGAPITYVLPDPDLGFHYDMGVMGWSKRPNAALVFADFAMSMNGQTIWHGRGESVSPLPNVPGSLPALKIDLWNPAAYPPDVIQKYRQHWASIMQ